MLVDGRRLQPANATLDRRRRHDTVGCDPQRRGDHGRRVVRLWRGRDQRRREFHSQGRFRGHRYRSADGRHRPRRRRGIAIQRPRRRELGDGRGNLMVGAEWAERNAVFQTDRDFIVEGWNDPGTTTGAVAATYWSCRAGVPVAGGNRLGICRRCGAGHGEPRDRHAHQSRTAQCSRTPCRIPLCRNLQREARFVHGPLAPTRKIMTFQNNVVGESNPGRVQLEPARAGFAVRQGPLRSHRQRPERSCRPISARSRSTRSGRGRLRSSRRPRRSRTARGSMRLPSRPARGRLSTNCTNLAYLPGGAYRSELRAHGRLHELAGFPCAGRARDAARFAHQPERDDFSCSAT